MTALELEIAENHIHDDLTIGDAAWFVKSPGEVVPVTIVEIQVDDTCEISPDVYVLVDGIPHRDYWFFRSEEVAVRWNKARLKILARSAALRGDDVSANRLWSAVLEMNDLLDELGVGR